MSLPVKIRINDENVRAFRREDGTYFFQVSRMLNAAGLSFSVAMSTILNNTDPSHFVKALIDSGHMAWFGDLAGYREYIRYQRERNRSLYLPSVTGRDLAILEKCLKECEGWIASQEAADRDEDEGPISFPGTPSAGYELDGPLEEDADEPLPEEELLDEEPEPVPEGTMPEEADEPPCEGHTQPFGIRAIGMALLAASGLILLAGLRKRRIW